MTMKEWLSQGRDISFRINELEREKKKLYEAAIGTVGHYDADRVQISCDNGSEKKIVLYASVAESLEKERTELLAVIDEISKLISAIENISFRRLLSMRYIEFMSWNRIADEMHYDTRYIFKLHARALGEAERITKKRDKQKRTLKDT